MIEGLDPSLLGDEPIDLELLRKRISSGNAVLFTGAGFSLDCVNLAGKSPPLASVLANELCKIANIKESSNLKYASDFALNFGDKNKILELLRKNYDLVKVPDCINNICKVKWRRVYTTNYDNSVELGYLNNRRGIHSLSLTDDPAEFLKGEHSACVHLNGSIKNSTVDDLKEKIKLSDSSYLSADFFLNSSWRSVFNKDVEHCSAIIFVGYSLYDIDVEKILYDRPHLKGKTYFITHPGAELESVYKLSSYGSVSKMATKGFGDLVKSVTFAPETDRYPQHFKRVKPTEELSTLDDFATRDLLLYGKYLPKNVETAYKAGFDLLYMIERSKIQEIITYLKDKKHVLIQSDLGNGKSVMVDQIAITLANDGYKTWKLEDFEGDISKDLELFDSNDQHVLIIDDISSVSDVFEYFSSLKPDNLTFLLTDRTINEFENIKSFVGDEVIVDSIDTLDEIERLQLIRILDDQNLWKKYTGLSEKRKDSIIVERFDSQISNVLIGLLESPEIKNRIEQILESLVSSREYKKTLFVIALCDVFGVKKDPANVAEIAGNEAVLTSTFKKTEGAKTLFYYGDNKLILKSSVLSLFIMNNFFNESYIVENCLEIMERVDKIHTQHITFLKSKLRTFHNVEKLMPKKQASLNNYFGELKRRCVWLNQHPHYWVQYAMCRLSFGDTEIAQEHLDTAYKYARLKSENYHTENIDTQQARLLLMKAIQIGTEKSASAKLFAEADRLLNSVTNDNRKFRQVIKYKEIYEKVFSNWGNKERVNFEHRCKHMLACAEEAIKNSNNVDKIRHIFLSKLSLEDVIASIKTQRKS